MEKAAEPSDPSRRSALRTALSVGAIALAVPSAVTVIALERSSVPSEPRDTADDVDTSEAAYVLYF